MIKFSHKIRTYIIAAWLLALGVILYLYLFKPEILHNQLRYAIHLSPWWGYTLYFLLSCIRGITLIPSTNLIVLGLLLFPPLPLFILTVAGIIVSSASVYYFSELLRLDEFFEARYTKRIMRIKSFLQKNELPVIIGWSFIPVLPTDLICYVCGTLKINFKKFIFGVFVGESIICGVYIFGGNYLLQLLRVSV